MLIQRCWLPVLVASLAGSLVAQTGRVMRQCSTPVIGGIARIVIDHPAAAAGNMYVVNWSFHTDTVTNLNLPFVNGLLRLDQNAFFPHYYGTFPGTSVTDIVPIPNNNALVGVELDYQSADIDPGFTQVSLADNDAVVHIVAGGICTVKIVAGTLASATTGDNLLQTIDDNTVCSPVSKSVFRHAYQPIRHYGQRGYVEGYAATFSSTPFNSDINLFRGDRPARNLVSAGYQTISLPGGYDIAVIRDTANPKQFSLLSINRNNGTSTVIPGSTVTDTSATAAPTSNYRVQMGFSTDGTKGVAIVADTNTVTPVPNRVYLFDTNGGSPIVDITSVAPVSTAYFEGSIIMANEVVIVGGSGGWFWAPLDGTATLAPITLPTTTATNSPNVWVYPSSKRVSDDGRTVCFQIGGQSSASRLEMDMISIRGISKVAAPGTVTNITQFAAQTGIGEMGLSGLTPSTSSISSDGIKSSLSPDSSKIAFVGFTGTSGFTGLYVAATDGSTPNPTVKTVAGALHYGEVNFVNNDQVVFTAGVSNTTTDFYSYTVSSDTITRLTNTGNMQTRGTFSSRNGNWLYFVRGTSSTTALVNNIVAIDTTTLALRDITGSEFSGGTAPSIYRGATTRTTNPWYALEFMLRRSPVGNDAFFVAENAAGATSAVFNDSNVFKFDIENAGQAVQLTSLTGTGTTAQVRYQQSLMISGDGQYVAWAERVGTAVTNAEDVYVMSAAGGTVRKLSNAAAGQTITDGSVHFTCNPPTGVVWSLGGGTSTATPNTNTQVQWAPLTGTSAALPLTTTAPGTRILHVVGATPN